MMVVFEYFKNVYIEGEAHGFETRRAEEIQY